ncbi:sugar ABC transporter ATP-binding protein [Kaistia geumhonensis]|uniref:ABC-type sugar transport system ATPase subunit n=1 Tax=Kaistia geumhonensis TaxID=410839 RepID=A0ABU0MB52_9HYPH|nr:sugar ABC transporter ATP-binding protein [Kaistia geumhonensis]MCX5481124.1 sugar ABC transporter ATP-binding protein [Kaistia geumhonensis]MDQ0518184.1 ABC-type sugar transport system ATPase subunit [Kaistia geumhonensis]
MTATTATSTDAATPLVELKNTSKTFGGIKVLKNVGFDVRPGEVHALLGENGAGKSTLIKILSGFHTPDEGGEILVNGRPVSFSSPRDARKAGISTVYQELLLFPDMTVAENIFIGHAPRAGMGALDWNEMRRRARELLDDLDSHDLDVDSRVGGLSVANRQRVEIAKALSQDARLLIMDEPTASLADADVRRLLDVVRRLRERGVAIIYISHRMPEIFALADRVTVLRDGSLIGTKDIEEVDDASLVSMMVGRSIDQLFPKVVVPIGEPVLELRNVSFKDEVQDISLTLRAGEILGIAGLVGSGRTELALTIFGITPATSGEILLNGRPVTIRSPQQARDLGIAYVPEDRGLQGLVKPQTIRENVSMALLDRISKGSIVDRVKESALARDAIARFGIRARGPEQRAGQLSGGNQQKVVLAKWVFTNPKVLIMDEPTRGIDVGAKSEIHALMCKLAGEGLAVIMISSELPEVLGMSDRIMVMNGGRMVRTFDRSEATPDVVGAAMTHAGASNAGGAA